MWAKISHWLHIHYKCPLLDWFDAQAEFWHYWWTCYYLVEIGEGISVFTIIYTIVFFCIIWWFLLWYHDNVFMINVFYIILFFIIWSGVLYVLKNHDYYIPWDVWVWLNSYIYLDEYLGWHFALHPSVKYFFIVWLIIFPFILILNFIIQKLRGHVYNFSLIVSKQVNKAAEYMYFGTYFYVLKFICFNIILIFYYIFYIILYSIFFIFKNFRFFSYYFRNASTTFLYYKKKSVYFLFWRYLMLYLISSFQFYIFYFMHFLIIQIKKFFYINNIYLFSFIYLKTKFYVNNLLFKNIFQFIYKFYFFLIYHVFYIINIDEIFLFLSKFNFDILNIFKYSNDSLLHRNSNIGLSSKYYSYYQQIYNKLLYFKNLWIIKLWWNNLFIKYTFSFIIYVINKLHLFLYNEKIVKYLLSILYVSKKIMKINIIIIIFKIIRIIIYYIYIIIINIMYNIIIYVIYIVYLFITGIQKFKTFILFSLLFLVLIKYYWFFFYYFFLLYQHYSLYLPLFDIKESIRFFNFEWVDLRNYFNLIFLHNSLVPLVELSKDNIIYNDLWNNLNKTLLTYGFKASYQYDLQLFSLSNIQNKDTKLINEVLGSYHKARSYRLLKWYLKMKKKIGLKSKYIFKYYVKKKQQKTPKSGSEVSFLRKNIKSHSLSLFINKDDFTKNYKIWNYFNKTYFTRKNRSFVSPNTSNFMKLNKIPLKSIYIFNNDKYLINIKKWSDYTTKIRRYSIAMTYIKKHIAYSYLWLKKTTKSYNYNLYFGTLYNFDGMKNKMQYKYKIPTFEWNSTRWRKKFSNLSFLSPTKIANNVSEDQIWYTYFETKRKKLTKKPIYKSTYIKYRYPFCMNHNKNIINILNYNNVLKNYIKIIKKYYYIQGLKKTRNKKSYKRYFYKLNHIMSKLFVYRLQNWDRPFYKKELGKINNNFWNFFDYLKTDKYYDIKNKNLTKDIDIDIDINFYFIKRIRKDYIKLRNGLLRLYSLYFNYKYLERASFKHFAYQGKQHGKQRMPEWLKRERAMWYYDSYKTNWYMKIYLSANKNNIKVFKSISILSTLFKKRFFAYFVYCDYTINNYNALYYIKIKSYRLRILNKINNLKRFFHFQNKQINGWSIFKYLNSFSLFYHIKHFLWHSPYSFLIFNDQYYYDDIIKNEDFYSNYIVREIFMEYPFFIWYNDKIIDINDYSIVFNLFSNIIEIKRFWYHEILDILDILKISDYNFLYEDEDIIFKFESNSIFCTYYNSGRSIIKCFYMTDIYRLIISLLFEYYKNFLYRLTRYRYILDLKNYTIMEFINRYFIVKNIYKHWYFRFRTQIYHKFLYGRIFRRRYRKKFPFKNLYVSKVYKKNLIPFWFLYDYYIKLFIYFLLNKYYTNQFFIFYWLLKNNYISYSYFSFLYYCDFKYKVIETLYSNSFKYYNFEYFSINEYFKYLCSIIISNNWYKILHVQFADDNINHIIFILPKGKDITGYIFYRYWLILDINNPWNWIKNVYIIIWYLKSCFNINDSYYSIFKLLYNERNKLFNWLMLEISNIFEYHLNLNKLFLIKIYLEKLLRYYFNNLFNIKNALIYFKSNYVYFRKQRGFKRRNKIVKMQLFRGAFKHTITRRNIYSFRNLTVNINFFKNIYVQNIYNYIYLVNTYHNNIFNLFFNQFKYNDLNILFYVFLYFFVFIILFLYYKNFYNLFFFCEKVESNLQKNWEKVFKKDLPVIMQAEKFSKKEYDMYKKIWSKKLNQNFYKYHFLNVFFKKLTTYEKIIYHKCFIDKKYYNSFFWNNNRIVEGGKSSFKLIWPFHQLNNSFDFLKKMTKISFKLKKENKIYNFYYLDSLNINLLNFCAFYWLLMIPWFFFEFILIKYHLKGHVRTRRKSFLLFKTVLNKFKWYIKTFRMIGSKVYSGWKTHHPKTYLGINTRNKKKLKRGFFFKWQRFEKLYLRMNSLGSYYLWFFQINKYEYFLSYFKYFFNFSYKSNYFYYINIYIFILLWIKIKIIKKNWTRCLI